MNPRGTMVPGDFLCNEGSVLDAVLYLGDAGALNFYRIGKKKMLHRQKYWGVGVALSQLLDICGFMFKYKS